MGNGRLRVAIRTIDGIGLLVLLHSAVSGFLVTVSIHEMYNAP